MAKGEYWRVGETVMVPTVEGHKARGVVVGFVWARHVPSSVVYVRFADPRYHHDASWLSLPGEVARPEPCRAFYAGGLVAMTRKVVA